MSGMTRRGAGLAAAAIALLTLWPAARSDAAGDQNRGRQVFAQCMACHRLDASGAAGIGPNLRGVVGRMAGSQPGFAYSAAMRGARQPWSEARLDAFLTAPGQTVPGNRMPFAGLKNAADRQAVIAYLRTAAQ